MTFFQESQRQQQPTLAPEQVAYFRGVLHAHTNGPATGKCPVCGLVSCPDWRRAYDQLAIAGEAMAQPETWAFEGLPGPWSR